jgi:hypothetical protein
MQKHVLCFREQPVDANLEEQQGIEAEQKELIEAGFKYVCEDKKQRSVSQEE